MRALHSAPLLAALALAGCAASTEPFPSLAPRPIEKMDAGFAVPAEAAPSPQPDPAADSAARAALANAEAGDRAFKELLAEVEPRIRAGASQPAGGDAWLEAQQALSRLQSARLATSDALQTLEDQLMARGPAAPGTVLEAAHARAVALVKAQTETVTTLAALLSDK